MVSTGIQKQGRGGVQTTGAQKIIAATHNSVRAMIFKYGKSNGNLKEIGSLISNTVEGGWAFDGGQRGCLPLPLALTPLLHSGHMYPPNTPNNYTCKIGGQGHSMGGGGPSRDGSHGQGTPFWDLVASLKPCERGMS